MPPRQDDRGQVRQPAQRGPRALQLDHGERRIMAGDKQIRLKPEASVLGHEAGDEIRVSEADFRLLSGAFLAEIEAKYR